MYRLTTWNPDDALEKGIKLLKEEGTFESSRAGEVLVMPAPVVTQWVPHRSLASLNPIRDANPFFHLNEAIWMLKGENDARLLDTFVSDFSKRFAEPDGTLHGAYGYRWRKHFDFDQIEWIIESFKMDHGSRQCVLDMWDPSPHDGNDLMGKWRDRPCNTHIYFRIQNDALDMTVCCRSNDMIWGAYGANVVHFGVLHEYMAAKIGVGLGFMYQVSNNFHAYTNVLGPLLLKMEKAEKWERPQCSVMAMFDWPELMDSDLSMWRNFGDDTHRNNLFVFTQQANELHRRYRNGEPNGPIAGAQNWDWGVACREWIKRRTK